MIFMRWWDLAAREAHYLKNWNLAYEAGRARGAQEAAEKAEAQWVDAYESGYAQACADLTAWVEQAQEKLQK